MTDRTLSGVTTLSAVSAMVSSTFYMLVVPSDGVNYAVNSPCSLYIVCMPVFTEANSLDRCHPDVCGHRTGLLYIFYCGGTFQRCDSGPHFTVIRSVDILVCVCNACISVSPTRVLLSGVTPPPAVSTLVLHPLISRMVLQNGVIIGACMQCIPLCIIIVCTAYFVTTLRPRNSLSLCRFCMKLPPIDSP